MSSRSRDIAVLGATGHVGKALLAELTAEGTHRVTAVGRDAEKLARTLAAVAQGPCESATFERAWESDFDVLINCVGEGNPANLIADPQAPLALTERFDALIVDYLARHGHARCISFSSGAAYGGDFSEPASEATVAQTPLNDLAPSSAYGVAKLASEVKHRLTPDLAIVDLRLFGFFSRHADLSAPYLMNDVIAAIQRDSVLQTSADDVMRDYIAPADLAALVLALIDAPATNEVYDLYSAAPVSKFELLGDFAQRYGLRYDVVESTGGGRATGVKPNYYSVNRRAERLGWHPTQTSIQALVAETDALLATRRKGLA